MILGNFSTNNTVFYEQYSAVVTDLIYTSLTANAANYLAAATNTWVNVTSAEYFSVLSNVPGTTTHVLPTSSLSLGSSAAWGVGYATTVVSSAAQVPTGTYIIGFVSRMFNTTGHMAPLFSYTFDGTYTEIASAATVTTSNTYFVRKAPQTSLSAAGYVAIVGDQEPAATNAITGLEYAYSNTNTGSLTGGTLTVSPPWTINSNTPVFFQVLGTTIKNW